MNWEAIGTIGEATGAIAVVITLIYLAIQLRHNTQSVHANTHQQILNAQQPLWLEQTNFAYAEEILSVIAKDSLTPAEALAAGSHAVLRCRAHQNIFNQVTSGALTREAANLDQLGSNVAFNPVVQRFWGESAPDVWPGTKLIDLLSPGYVSYLAQLLEKQSSDA